MLIVFMNFAPNKIYYSANNILFESKFNSLCSFCCGGTLMKIMASILLPTVQSLNKLLKICVYSNKKDYRRGDQFRDSIPLRCYITVL